MPFKMNTSTWCCILKKMQLPTLRRWQTLPSCLSRFSLTPLIGPCRARNITPQFKMTSMMVMVMMIKWSFDDYPKMRWWKDYDRQLPYVQYCNITRQFKMASMMVMAMMIKWSHDDYFKMRWSYDEKIFIANCLVCNITPQLKWSGREYHCSCTFRVNLKVLWVALCNCKL